MAETGLSYCAAQIKQHDHDRYLTALLAPVDRREDLFALYAFNLEVARIAEIVGEAALGHMRLQWWRDVLLTGDGNMAGHHPVADALGSAIGRHGLDRTLIGRILDGREADLLSLPPADLATLETYTEKTSASLVILALECLGERMQAAEVAARGIGMAWALIGLIRAVPFHARQRRLYLPGNVMAAEGLDSASVFELKPSRPLQAVAARLAERARSHLQTARAEAASIPRSARPPLMLGILADRALLVLHRAKYDPFSPTVQRQDPSRAWRLAVAKWRGRF